MSLATSTPPRVARDPRRRTAYAQAALSAMPRLIASLDRHPWRATSGSFERNYWHYRTAAFPCAMYQEGVLPLALVYCHAFPGNRWHQAPRVRDFVVAGLRFLVGSLHRDGSCDDYYPFERALGAAVFNLQAATQAYSLLQLDEPKILTGLERLGRWVAEHDEAGILSNHHALAALGLWRLGRLTGQPSFAAAARERVRRVLDWQSEEGWFVEYGGADPGYQTVTIDALAKLRAATGETTFDKPLRRAVAFAAQFRHPDGSYAGEYGSRGTTHFYPHGFELLAPHDPRAALLAEHHLDGLERGTTAVLVDDRLYVHRLANLLEAHHDWAPETPPLDEPRQQQHYWSHAQMLVDRRPERLTIIAAARGGSFKHFADNREQVTDSGLVVETTCGRTAVSQAHDLNREIRWLIGPPAGNMPRLSLSIRGPLVWSRHETATPFKQAVFHLGMIAVGRRLRTWVRRLLQRRLITGRRRAPIELERTIELLPAGGLRVTDRIRLTDARLRVARLAFASDFEAAYVAAAGAYHAASLQSWTDLASSVEALNERRQLTVVRTW